MEPFAQEPNHTFSPGGECPTSRHSSAEDSASRSREVKSGESAGKSRVAAPRREIRWSKAARELVRANKNPTAAEFTALVSRLTRESGNPRWACRRFARSMGIRSRRSYRAWTEQEQQRLLKLIDLHPVNEIARLLRRSQSSIWHMLQRLGGSAKMGKDSFTIYTLAVALHIRPEKIKDWIGREWLNSRQIETGKAVRTVIDAEDFCNFCKKHTRDVVGNRLTEERLDFVYHFVFPPSHAELLPVRESKKEREAYEKQFKEQSDEDSNGFDLDGSENDDDTLGRSA
jgi:hypothetical protein